MLTWLQGTWNFHEKVTKSTKYMEGLGMVVFIGKCID